MQAPSEVLQKLGVISLPELELRCVAEPEQYVVDGLISESSVNLAAGDSGLGKSPWAYQVGLCVASGVAFLGHAVRKGRVLYIDLENGRSGILEVCKSLAGYIGISPLPDNFYLLTDREQLQQLAAIVKEISPILIIIDSLRAYRPEAEEKSANAAVLVNELRRIARMYKVSFLIIHHIRKPGENGVPALEESTTMTWLHQACGARALVNQTDVRIAFDVNAGAGRVRAGKASKNASEDINLVVKGFARLRGEFGPWFLTRDFDEDGSPIGYRRMRGVELLFNESQQAAFGRLPESFTFKEARLIYGKRDQATTDFLQKCRRVGILSHPSRLYVKITEPTE